MGGLLLAKFEPLFTKEQLAIGGVVALVAIAIAVVVVLMRGRKR